MRFRLTMILLLGIIIGLSAHILEEGFEGSELPADWSMIDYDEDGNNWFVYEHNPHSGNNSISSASWVAGQNALTPDNWLITPALEIADSTYLSWWTGIQDFDYPVEHYSVMLSTTGTAVEDFTTEIYSVTTDSSYYSWQNSIVDLFEYSGQTIYLAWRHHSSTDQFYLKIDDILVTNEVVDNDADGLVAGVTRFNTIYPNPFNPETNISFYVEEAGNVDLAVYNIKGQFVEQLVSGSLDQGDHKIVWQANSKPSGMYLFRLSSPAGIDCSKALLLK